ncbi:unnamed protein product [Linum tenue]|uniref:Uncharacterized protein n=1 Tax=Linum tenue TaxID=586396 RepID=A0AAV0LQ28_9ROSI|nr:unnamed protein product [Linum tenue]
MVQLFYLRRVLLQVECLGGVMGDSSRHLLPI